jgi:hypothetical protein
MLPRVLSGRITGLDLIISSHCIVVLTEFQGFRIELECSHVYLVNEYKYSKKKSLAIDQAFIIAIESLTLPSYFGVLLLSFDTHSSFLQNP